MAEQPTEFSGNPSDLTGNDELINLKFNAPSSAFTNTGAIAATVSLTSDSGSGYPAKYRGIYFNGSNAGRIELPSYMLYHSFLM